MRSRLPAGKGRLPCCTTLLPFTSGARSPCPAVCPPGATHTWLGLGSCWGPLLCSWLINRHGLHGGQSWVGDSTWACVRLRAKFQEGWYILHHATPNPAQPWGDRGGICRLLRPGKIPTHADIQVSVCLCVCGVILWKAPTQPCSAWRTFIST